MNDMKKMLVIIPVLLFNLFVPAQQKFNDPNAELREAKYFHAISVSNAFDVYLSQSDKEVVAVSASEEKYRKDIKVEVENEVLKISFKKEGKFWHGWNSNKTKLKAYISFKVLDRLTASGACDIHVEGTIKSDELKVNLSGASDWKEGSIDVKKLSVSVSGASVMNVKGTALQSDIDASGASDFKGFEFNTDSCDARASGASNINITVNKVLSAHASGASDVHYKGAGMIKEIKASGASNISKRS